MKGDYIHIEYSKTPFGEIIMGSYKNELCLCDWRYRKMRTSIDKRITGGLKAEYLENSAPIITRTKHQLDEYFEGSRTEFNIPILFVGTSFQKQVWNELLQIPFGRTESYLSLSKKTWKRESHSGSSIC